MKDHEVRKVLEELAQMLGFRIIERDGELHVVSGELAKRFVSRREHHRDLDKLRSRIIEDKKV